MNDLTKYLVESLLLEEEGITVLLPGGFKPPHAGHLQLADKYAERQDVKEVLVMVGPVEREGITREESIRIWNILATDSKIKVIPVNFDNPIQAAYEYALRLPKNSKAKLAMAASSKGEDAKRSDIFVQAINEKYKTQGTQDGRFIPEGVLAVKLPVDVTPLNYTTRTDGFSGSISASVLRRDLQKKDIENIKSNYPNLSDEELNKVVSILLKKPIQIKETTLDKNKVKQFIQKVKRQGGDAKKGLAKLIRREKLNKEEKDALITALKAVGVATIPGGSIIALGTYLAPKIKKAAKNLLSEGGAGGHMAHPFDFTNTGEQLIKVFEDSIKSIKRGEKGVTSVKIDGVNASVRLADIDGKREFAMDRGSASDLDIKGVTAADLPLRFTTKTGEEHGFVGIGGEVLEIFNEALKSQTIRQQLSKLGLMDNPNILLNLEYVGKKPADGEGGGAKTNVIEYKNKFLAIHGLKEIKPKVDPKTGKPKINPKTGKVMSREAHTISYDKEVMQAFVNELNKTASKYGFEVLGSTDVTFEREPDLNKPLGEKITLYPQGKPITKSLKDWLQDAKFQTPLIRRQDYLQAIKSKNIAEDFPNLDLKKVVYDTIVYIAIIKLGDEILNNATSALGELEKHEGIVINDDSIYKGHPFKITGKFLIGGMQSGFGVKENLTEEKEIVATAPALNLRLHFEHTIERESQAMPGVDLNGEITISSTGGKKFAKTLQSSEQAQAYSNKVKSEITQAFKEFDAKLQSLFTKYKL